MIAGALILDLIQAGRKVSFKTWGGTVVTRGLVLSRDDYLSLPLRIEYLTAGGDKRIERFHPDEFEEFRNVLVT